MAWNEASEYCHGIKLLMASSMGGLLGRVGVGASSTTTSRDYNEPARRSSSAFDRCFVCRKGTAPWVSAANLWDGGGANANWTTAENWDNDVTPTFAAGLGITFGGNANLNPLLTANTTIGTITFNNTAGAIFDLKADPGITLTLNSNSNSSVNLVTNNDTDTQTISAPIILASTGGETNISAASGDLIFNGSIGFTRVARFNANANRTLTINGDLNGVSASSGVL